MPTASLEERITALETEIEQIKIRLPEPVEQSPIPWWKRIVGVYEDDPEFDEAERLGRKWRDSFSPKADEVAPL